MARCILSTLALTILLSVRSAAQEAGSWATYRGNLQRTGCVADAGPITPKVLWSLKSEDHFIAAPVPGGGRLFASGLGGFNLPNFYALDADPKAAKRSVWNQSVPVLNLPTVSSPAAVDGKLIFGDGMHQTEDRANLHCIRQDNGRPLWRLSVPGTLVHIEGSPTVSDGFVYFGAGAAGVLCVEMNKVTLENKEMDLVERKSSSPRSGPRCSAIRNRQEERPRFHGAAQRRPAPQAQSAHCLAGRQGKVARRRTRRDCR